MKIVVTWNDRKQLIFTSQRKLQVFFITNVIYYKAKQFTLISSISYSLSLIKLNFKSCTLLRRKLKLHKCFSYVFISNPLGGKYVNCRLNERLNTETTDNLRRVLRFTRLF